MTRFLRRAVLGLLLVVVLYEAVTFFQVWRVSRRDEAAPSQAIVVFGAAQYDGRPSAVLEARLDHATELWQRRFAPWVVVTGGRRSGDRFTEAQASASYLHSKGVPDRQIVRVTDGADSWESLAAAARVLKQRHLTKVLLVSDPFHSARIGGIAHELGLQGKISPTRTSPITGREELKHIGRETVAVSVGRLIGYRRLMRVDRAVERGRRA